MILLVEAKRHILRTYGPAPRPSFSEIPNFQLLKKRISVTPPHSDNCRFGLDGVACPQLWVRISPDAADLVKDELSKRMPSVETMTEGEDC